MQQPEMEDGGDTGGKYKHQKTQLRNLRQAGAANSSFNMRKDEDKDKFVNHLLNRSLDEKGVKHEMIDVKDLRQKKGQTKRITVLENEEKYYDYEMETDLFEYKELIKKEDFAFKQYKESLYRGQVVQDKR